MDTIASFSVALDNEILSLNIKAQDFEIGDDGDDTCWAEADYIEITEVKPDGTETHYTPVGMTWSGHQYDEADLLGIVASIYINNEARGYTFHSVCPELEQMRQSNLQNTICSVNGYNVPAKYYDFRMGWLFKLAYVTNENIYYTYYDSVRMFNTNMELISDNYFAEEGLLDSIQQVVAGNEHEIYCDADLEEYKRDVINGVYD